MRTYFSIFLFLHLYLFPWRFELILSFKSDIVYERIKQCEWLFYVLWKFSIGFEMYCWPSISINLIKLLMLSTGFWKRQNMWIPLLVFIWILVGKKFFVAWSICTCNYGNKIIFCPGWIWNDSFFIPSLFSSCTRVSNAVVVQCNGWN